MSRLSLGFLEPVHARVNQACELGNAGLTQVYQAVIAAKIIK